MDAREAATRWRDVWERGWREHETGEILGLYAEGATLQSHPFREPVAPAEYIGPTLGEEVSAECWFGEPLVDGDRAAVEWWAFVREDGRDITLAGTSLLRFREDGQCVEQRDAWAAADGRVERRPGPNGP